MINLSGQLKLAFQLRKDKKINEALAIYEALWQLSPREFGEWDGWSYGQCLKEKRRYMEALELCRQLYPKYKESEMIRQLYAWCIYYTQLAGDKQPTDKNEFIKTITAIVQLSPPGKAFSPAVKSIFKLIKFFAGSGQSEWDTIGYWLAKLDKDKLSKVTYTIDVPNKRRMELASELEEWYSWQSKWLLQTKQWEECVALCDEALLKLDKWHYSNDIWFARRKAAALIQLGFKKQALETLQPLIKRKREWFILADLAEITEDNSEALKLYAEAALAYGELPKKIRVFYKMALLYNTVNDKELALSHGLLVKAIRQENEWPVPVDLQQMLLDLGEPSVELIPSFKMVQGLKPQWEKLTSANQIKTNIKNTERLNGKIDHFIGGGDAGFIKPEAGGNKIYFLFKNFQDRRDEIKPGLNVSFAVIKSWDKKKNRDSEMAVRIKKRI